MEETSKENGWDNSTDIIEFEDKLAMFLSDEETAKTHPLNHRIHNPCQYVYTCDSFKWMLAWKLCLRNFINIENIMINYLMTNNIYTDNKDIQLIITKILHFEGLLQVIIINLRHQEILKFSNDFDENTVQKFIEANIMQELEENEKLQNK